MSGPYGLDTSTTQIITRCPRCRANVELRLDDRYIDDGIDPPDLVANFRGVHECEP
jgi:hypothetical protein